MARYEHLPLYKTAMELTVYIETVVRTFSRYHKYTLGTDLRQQSRASVTMIIRANSRREKLPVLADLRERVEAFQVLLRICKDVKAFAKFEAYAHAAQLGKTKGGHRPNPKDPKNPTKTIGSKSTIGIPNNFQRLLAL